MWLSGQRWGNLRIYLIVSSLQISGMQMPALGTGNSTNIFWLRAYASGVAGPQPSALATSRPVTMRYIFAPVLKSGVVRRCPPNSITSLDRCFGQWKS